MERKKGALLLTIAILIAVALLGSILRRNTEYFVEELMSERFTATPPVTPVTPPTPPVTPVTPSTPPAQTPATPARTQSPPTPPASSSAGANARPNNMIQVSGFVDFAAGNINVTPLTVNNYSDCQQRCVQRPNCVATTYNTQTKACNLKNNIMSNSLLRDQNDATILTLRTQA